MGRKFILSMEELNELEALEIFGGVSEDNKTPQNGCPNNSSGCACIVQNGCAAQNQCPNNVAGCGCQAPPTQPTN